MHLDCLANWSKKPSLSNHPSPSLQTLLLSSRLPLCPPSQSSKKRPAANKQTETATISTLPPPTTAPRRRKCGQQRELNHHSWFMSIPLAIKPRKRQKTNLPFLLPPDTIWHTVVPRTRKKGSIPPATAHMRQQLWWRQNSSTRRSNRIRRGKTLFWSHHTWKRCLSTGMD